MSLENIVQLDLRLSVKGGLFVFSLSFGRVRYEHKNKSQEYEVYCDDVFA